MERKFPRKDINVIGIPMASICAEHYDDPRQRQLFKNIICLGALSVLLKIDMAILKGLIKEEFQKKPKLIEPNLHALGLGRKYAQNNLASNFGLQLKSMRQKSKKIMIQGNEASGLGCVFAGATVASWYPITPWKLRLISTWSSKWNCPILAPPTRNGNNCWRKRIPPSKN